VSSYKETQRKGFKTLLAIAVIAVAVYIGFEPLMKLVPEGVAQSVVSASFSAIFVIILTMYLLNKQTEIEQESKKSERVFDEKVKLYQAILDITRDMLMDGKISEEEINRLPFPLIRLAMLGGDDAINAFKEVNNKLNEIYSSNDDKEVTINEDDKNHVYKLLTIFAGLCRKDLGISEEAVDEQILEQTVETLSSTGKKKRDMTKYSFDGKAYPKNQYIFRVIKNFADSNTNMTLDEFSKKVPRTTDFRKDVWVTFEESKEVEERDRKRHYNNENEVINLTDAAICVTNGQDKKGTLAWIELFKRNGIRTE
jgi:hypothetical protein